MVVAVATVAASPEDMKEVVVVVEEGEASRQELFDFFNFSVKILIRIYDDDMPPSDITFYRMPMDSRSRTTKTCQPPLF